ncbi:MAG: VCBS repeat-containing protein, partial [Myxococcales bacterium]|nr:VCBS repeat-containing protein [Myxococcales bacterium]
MTSPAARPLLALLLGSALAPALACGDDTMESATATAGSSTSPTTATTGDATTAGTVGSSGESDSDSDATQGSSSTDGVTDATTIGTTEEPTTSETGSTTEDVKFDMPDDDADMGPPPSMCKVVDDMNAVGDCMDSAPPDSFEPDVQWEFLGPPGFDESIATPLVANFTDDNDDGEIDLCDIPDVLVIAGPGGGDTPPSRLYLLDGETGVPHGYAEQLVQFAHTPAIGDIDNDGLPEIVVVDSGGILHALEHDLTTKWDAANVWSASQSSAIALADVDADGDVEIAAGTNLWDHTGALLWSKPGDQIYSATAIADLDGDGLQEILTGAAAYHADGTLYWENAGVKAVGTWAHPQVADVDDDGLPEVLVTTNSGIHLLEHDGTTVYANAKPTNDNSDWNRPLNIHDLDGDGMPEMGASSPGSYGVYEALDVAVLWVKDVQDSSGQAGGTAFDFLGAGIAQTVYADEYTMYVYDDQGNILMSTPRRSGTVIEYPVVADID